MEPDPKDPKHALCADLLAPEGYGEITGGGQRMSDYEMLKNKIIENKLPLEAYEWYLDLRKYGIDHLRETIPYPRMLTRLYP